MPAQSPPVGPRRSAAHRPVAGILWMVGAGLCFVATNALVKSLGTRLPSPEAAFLRFLFGLVFLLPLARRLVRARPTPRQWRLFWMRGLVHGLGVMFWFFAMTRIPLSEVTAMNYLQPVWLTIGAALFLGERLAARRISAIAVALVGALVILRPGFRELEPGHFAMLTTGLLFSASYMFAKVLAAETGAAMIVAMFSLCVTIVLAPFAAYVWVPPAPGELALLLGVACFATAGHYAMTFAFAAAPLGVTQPVTFLQLVWAVLLGAAYFGEPADIWVILGGAAIIGAVSFISWRERIARQRAAAPASAAARG